MAPRCSSSQELAVRHFEGLPGLEEIEEREEAGRATATDAAPAVAFGVVAWVLFAPGLDPLGDIQSGSELEHVSSFWKGAGAGWTTPAADLGCEGLPGGFLAAALMLPRE